MNEKDKEVSEDTQIVTTKTVIDDLVIAVRAARPILNSIINTFGYTSLGDYIGTFSQKEAEPVQKPSNFIAIMSRYTAEVLGEEVAQKLEKTLNFSRGILTADHLGPINWALTAQADIIYALSKQSAGQRSKFVVPVLAFGIVPLNNPNYARGFAFAREKSSQGIDKGNKSPKVKVNIFPDHDKTALVSLMRPFTAKMIDDALRQVDSLAVTREITDSEKKTLIDILEKDYKDQNVLGQTNYSRQLTIINYHIWRRIFKKEIREYVPDLVFLEVEEIVRRILIGEKVKGGHKGDLFNKQSFMYKLLFNKKLRTAVIRRLDKKYACWNQTNLAQLMQQDESVSEKEESSDTSLLATKDSEGSRGVSLREERRQRQKNEAEKRKQKRLQKAIERRELMAKAGTTFFWGIDKRIEEYR